jgi:hypothetical protein
LFVFNINYLDKALKGRYPQGQFSLDEENEARVVTHKRRIAGLSKRWTE